MKKIFTLLFSLSLLSIYAQETSDYVKGVSELACECVSKINIDFDKKKKSEEIETCIKSSNVTYQVEQSMLPKLQKVKDSLSKLIKSSKDTVNVKLKGGETIINSEKHYTEIEEYLYDNCEELKKMYFIDNTEHDNSYSDKKKAKKFYDEGQVAFAKKDYTKAIKLYRKAVRNDKTFAFAWDNLGYSYRKIEKYDKAIECYEKSLKLDPKGKMPLMNIAVAYSLNEDFESAKKYYKIYSGYYKEDPEGYYGIGRLYFLEKDYVPALDNMIQAYILYSEMKSPYYIDAQKHIGAMYNHFKENGDLETFNKLAKKHNLNVEAD